MIFLKFIWVTFPSYLMIKFIFHDESVYFSAILIPYTNCSKQNYASTRRISPRLSTGHTLEVYNDSKYLETLVAKLSLGSVFARKLDQKFFKATLEFLKKILQKHLNIVWQKRTQNATRLLRGGIFKPLHHRSPSLTGL